MGFLAGLAKFLDAALREEANSDDEPEETDTSEDPEDLDAEEANTEVIEDFPAEQFRRRT